MDNFLNNIFSNFVIIFSYHIYILIFIKENL